MEFKVVTIVHDNPPAHLALSIQEFLESKTILEVHIIFT